GGPGDGHRAQRLKRGAAANLVSTRGRFGQSAPVIQAAPDAVASVVGLGARATPHVLKRMVDRGFTEVDLRQMLEDGSSFRPDVEEGRWVIVSRHRRRSWEIIVEPDEAEQVLVVITAYPVVGRRRS